MMSYFDRTVGAVVAAANSCAIGSYRRVVVHSSSASPQPDQTLAVLRIAYMGSHLGAAVAPLLRPACSRSHTCTKGIDLVKPPVGWRVLDIHTGCGFSKHCGSRCRVDYEPVNSMQCEPRGWAGKHGQPSASASSQRSVAVRLESASAQQAEVCNAPGTHHVILGGAGRVHVSVDHAVQQGAQEIVAAHAADWCRVQQSPYGVVIRVRLAIAWSMSTNYSVCNSLVH